MNDIKMQNLKHTGGEWRVRKTVDESGDYPFPTYDILAIYEWGPVGIACADQNPHNARLMAAAPDMLRELINFCGGNCIDCSGKTEGCPESCGLKNAKEIIERATGLKMQEVLDTVSTRRANANP